MFESEWSNDAIWCHRTWSTLVQVMACRLFNNNPLQGLPRHFDDGVLNYHSELTLSQEFQPMAEQLSMKAALPLAKNLVTASWRSSDTGPWNHEGYTANIIIKDIIDIFASLSKIIRILLMGQGYYEHCLSELEQLERLRSEITPATPWLPILVIHIRSQVKTRQSQNYKFKKIAKNSNFEILQGTLQATHLQKLPD